MHPKHTTARRVSLALESLSDRVVPSCTWVEENGVLTISGDSSANVVDIVDDGTTLTITCDGENVDLQGEVTDIVLSLGSGNDEVTYTLQGALAGTRTLDVSLGNGHDSFSAVLEDGTDPDTGDTVASSLGDGAVLDIVVRGMNGHDSLSFDASATDVGAGATLSVALGGGNGKDTLDANFGGLLLGDVFLSLSGGNGKDTAVVDATFDAGSTGSVDIEVLGGNGKDRVGAYVTDNSGDDGDPSTDDTSTLTEFVALVDGGRGPDIADVTGDVEVVGAKVRGKGGK